MFKKKESQKPLKEIKGTDKNLAKAMQMKAKEDMTPEQRQVADKKQWVQDHIERVQAHGERFFETDEDLPLANHLLLFFIICFFVIFFFWASFASLDEVTRGDGRIIPSTEIQKISSLEGGIVEKFFIKKGDEVKAGQILVRLSDIAASSDLGSNNARYLGLLATVTRLQAEVEGKLPEFADEVMQGAPQSVVEEMNAYRANQDKVNSMMMIMEQQKSQRSQELNELQVRSSDVRGQLRLVQEEKEMVAPLVAKGSAPKNGIVAIRSPD